MAYDLLISNGTVVDGNGGPRFNADVAVQGGSIVALGEIEGSAATMIDAAGKIVCPGFVDPHTHYDAQITWDRLLSSSAEHGVTTVVMGNCGVGIAPCRPSAREWLTEDLVTVEGIDKEVLVEGIKWEWETFPEYIDAAARRGPQSRVSRPDHAFPHICARRGGQRAGHDRGGNKNDRRAAGRGHAGRRLGLYHYGQPVTHRPRRQSARCSPREPRRTGCLCRRPQAVPARRDRAGVDQALCHARRR